MEAVYMSGILNTTKVEIEINILKLNWWQMRLILAVNVWIGLKTIISKYIYCLLKSTCVNSMIEKACVLLLCWPIPFGENYPL